MKMKKRLIAMLLLFSVLQKRNIRNKIAMLMIPEIIIYPICSELNILSSFLFVGAVIAQMQQYYSNMKARRSQQKDADFLR